MALSTTNLSLTVDSAIDLHLHTTYSDDHWTVESLLDLSDLAQDLLHRQQKNTRQVYE